MFTWKEYYTEAQIRADQIAEAEHDRLVRSVERPGVNPLRRMFGNALGVLGTWMVRWGDALIGRCEDMARANYHSTTQSNV